MYKYGYRYKYQNPFCYLLGLDEAGKLLDLAAGAPYDPFFLTLA